MEDNLQRRGQALEDAFFQQRDQQLMERLTRELADKQAREALAAVSGISHEKVLQALVNQKIGPGNLVSLTLVPLVAIAWADGEVQSEEAAAISRAAAESGIDANSATGELLAGWLRTKPSAQLFEAWRLYVTSLKCTLSESEFRQLGETVLARTEGVAKAAGGFLGIGAMSVSEKKLLDEIRALLQA